MSLLQVFPNCTSVLHRLVFVFVFLLLPFQQHALSVFPSHSLLSACTAPRYPLSQRISITAWFSSPPHLCLSIQLFVRLPVNLLRLCWFLLFLQGAWCDFSVAQSAVSEWWAPTYLLSDLSLLSSPRSSSSSSSPSSPACFFFTERHCGSCHCRNLHRHHHRDHRHIYHLLLSVVSFSGIAAAIWRGEMTGW